MMARKLKRSEIAQVLDTVPIETVLLGAANSKTRSLTAKQIKFAEAVAMGKSKAAAYRTAYNTQATSEAQSTEGRRLVNNPRVALQIKAFQVAAEAKRYATPAALRSLVIEQLTAMAVDDDIQPAQRLRALELLGKVTEVAAFTERREIVKVTDAGDARARLVESLRAALAATSIDVTPTPDAIEVDDSGTPHPLDVAGDSTDPIA